MAKSKKDTPPLEPPPAMQGMNKYIIVTTLAIAIMTLIFIFLSTQKPTPTPLTSVPEGPTYGVATAPHHVVVFQDFKCPHCAVLHDELEGFIDGPVQAGEAQLTVLNFPFIAADSTAAAAASECAYTLGGVEAYREYSNLLFDEQRRVQEKFQDPWITEDLLNTFAEKVGLPLSEFQTCATSEETRSRIKLQAEAYDKGTALGTPGVFVDGTYTRQTLADILQAME